MEMIKKERKRRKTPKKTQRNQTTTTAVAKVRCKRCKSILKIQNLQANVQSKRAKDNESGGRERGATTATTTTLTGKVLRSLLTCAQFPLHIRYALPPASPSLTLVLATAPADTKANKATNCANLHHDKQVSGENTPCPVPSSCPLPLPPCCHISVDNNRWRY